MIYYYCVNKWHTVLTSDTMLMYEQAICYYCIFIYSITVLTSDILLYYSTNNGNKWCIITVLTSVIQAVNLVQAALTFS